MFLAFWRSISQPWICTVWSMHASFYLHVVSQWCAKSFYLVFLEHAKEFFVIDKSFYQSVCQRSFQPQEWKSIVRDAKRFTFLVRNTWTLMEPTLESALQTFFSKLIQTSIQKMAHLPISHSFSDSKFSAWKDLPMKRNTTTVAKPSTNLLKRSCKSLKQLKGLKMSLYTSNNWGFHKILLWIQKVPNRLLILSTSNSLSFD